MNTLDEEFHVENGKITITHFINPHLFWYIPLDSPKDNLHTLEAQNDNIAQYIRQLTSRSREPAAYLPSIGDIVAVNYFPFKKYIRARIDHVFSNHDNTTYVVWAVDYGFPILTSHKFVYNLPARFAEPSKLVRCGGIANVIAAEKDFDIFKNAFQLEPKEHWSRQACEKLKHLIELSRSLRFGVSFYDQSNDQHWGELNLITSTGGRVTASNYLLQMAFALREPSNEKFRQICATEQLAGLCPWKNNEGKLIYERNTYEAIKTDSHNEKIDSLLLKKSYTKVEEWLKQNSKQRREEDSQPSSLKRVGSEGQVSATHGASQRTEKSPYSLDKPLASLSNMKNGVNRLQIKLEDFDMQSVNSTEDSTVISSPSKPDYKLKFSKHLRNLKQGKAKKNIDETREISKDDLESVASPSNASNRTSLIFKRFAESRLQRNRCLPAEENSENNANVCNSRKESIDTRHIAELSASVQTTLTSPSTAIEKLKARFNRVRNKSLVQPAEKGNDQMARSVHVSTLAKESQQHTVDHHTESLNWPAETSYKTETSEKIKSNAFNTQKEDIKQPIAPPSVSRKTVPAGYDITRENVYKNESSHWHRMKTTREVENTEEKLDRSNAANVSKEENNERSKSSSSSFSTSTLSGREMNSDLTPILEFTESRKANFENFVLAHDLAGQLHKCDSLADSGLSPLVLGVMHDMKLKELCRLQYYAWPHITSGKSAFIIGPPRSGKTLCYVPAVCSVLHDYKRAESSGHGIRMASGPLIMVLAPNCQQVDDVFRNLQRFTRCIQPAATIVALYGLRNLEEIKAQLLNGCDILVTTPAAFMRLAKNNSKQPLLDGSRIKQYVVDDVDVLLSRSAKEFNALFLEITKLRKQGNTLPQLVVTSRIWNNNIERLIPLGISPAVLISDFLEAAVYGGFQLGISYCCGTSKLAEIEKFLESHPIKSQSLMIICKDDEIAELEEFLLSKNLAAVKMQCQSAIECQNILEQWQLKMNPKPILLCSDSYDFKVSGVENLIHYSLPATWTKFARRFSVFTDSYKNVVQERMRFKQSRMPNDSAERRTFKGASLVLLDDRNNKELPKLMDFMKRHNKLKEIHPHLSEIIESVELEIEEQRREKNVRLCPMLLEFGECRSKRDCCHRHILTEDDINSLKDKIPSAGILKLKILKVLSPTHFVVQLLEHKRPPSSNWRTIRKSDDFVFFECDLQLHYSDAENLVGYWPINLNETCIYREKGMIYRAIVIRAPHVVNTNVMKTFNVDIRLIDAGAVKSNVSSSNLFRCDSSFKEFPRQAVDLHLLNVVPVDKEYFWDQTATSEVEKMLTIKQDESILVEITCVLSDCVWVKNLYVQQHLIGLRTDIYRLNLRQFLLENNYGCSDGSMLEKVRKFINGLHATGVKQESDSDSESDSSCNESADLESFSGKEDCTTSSIEVRETEQTAATLSSFKNQDLGGNPEPQLVEKEEPLQSTVVKNYSAAQKQFVESWAILPLYELVPVSIGSERSCKNLYLLRSDSVYVDSYIKLLHKIRDFVEEQKAHKSSYTIDVSQIRPKDNFLVKHRGDYLRAKLTSIYGTQQQGQLYVFYLCDEGSFVNMPRKGLLNDFLYRTSKEVLSFLPYRSMHATLCGIKFENHHPDVKLSNKYLFALSNGEKTRASLLHGCKINSYKILLYESDKSRVENVEKLKLINKELVKAGAAVYNRATKHHLNLALDPPLDEWKQDDFIWQKNDDKSDLEQIRSSIQSEIAEVLPQKSETGRKQVEQIASNGQAVHAISHNFQDTKALFRHILSLEDSDSSSETNTPEVSLSKKEDKSKALTNLRQEEERYAEEEEEEQDFEGTTGHTLFVCDHKKPIITWYETDKMLFLWISAPEAKDYELKVTRKTLYFATIIDGEQFKTFLVFRYSVDPTNVSHEMRGLKVVVRIKKLVYLMWSRLLSSPNKVGWLKYNLDAIPAEEIHDVLDGNEQWNLRDDDDSLEDRDGNDNDECFTTYHNMNPREKDLDLDL